MASATSALATLSPYLPPDGLGPREILAHAKDHIDRLTKKHASLQEVLQKGKEYGVSKIKTGVASGLTVVTSGALGFVNGRYGGDKGYVAPFHVPIDLATALVAHTVGLTDVFGDLGSLMAHAVGDASLGAGTYRFAFAKGAYLAARAAAAKGGAVAGAGAGAGTGAPGAAHPNGQRPSTTYAVPQK
jgi:hypothetical protein